MLRFNYGIKVSDVVKVLKYIKSAVRRILKNSSKISSFSIVGSNVYISNAFLTYTIEYQAQTFFTSKLGILQFKLQKQYSKKEFVDFLDELIKFLNRYLSTSITFDFYDDILLIHDIVNEEFLRDFLHFCLHRKNPVTISFSFETKPTSFLHPAWYKWAYDFFQENGVRVIEYDTDNCHQYVTLSNNLRIGFHSLSKIQVSLSQILALDENAFGLLCYFINETIKQFYVNDVATIVIARHFLDKQITEWISQLLFICNKSQFSYTSIKLDVPNSPEGRFTSQIEPVALFKLINPIQEMMINYLLNHGVKRFYLNCRMHKQKEV